MPANYSSKWEPTSSYTTHHNNMEIQLGFRLSGTQELHVLAQALSLVEDKKFSEYLRYQQVLPTLAQKEAELNQHIQELANKLGLLEEFDRLRDEVERLKAEKEQLVSEINKLKQAAEVIRSVE